jgi:hypothetical protein
VGHENTTRAILRSRQRWRVAGRLSEGCPKGIRTPDPWLRLAVRLRRWQTAQGSGRGLAAARGRAASRAWTATTCGGCKACSPCARSRRPSQEGRTAEVRRRPAAMGLAATSAVAALALGSHLPAGMMSRCPSTSRTRWHGKMRPTQSRPPTSVPTCGSTMPGWRRCMNLHVVVGVSPFAQLEKVYHDTTRRPGQQKGHPVYGCGRRPVSMNWVPVNLADDARLAHPTRFTAAWMMRQEMRDDRRFAKSSGDRHTG